MGKKESKKDSKKARAEKVGGLEGLLGRILTATVDRVMSYAPKVVQKGYEGLRRVMVDYVAHEVDNVGRGLKTCFYDFPLREYNRRPELYSVAIPCLLPLGVLYFAGPMLL